MRRLLSLRVVGALVAVVAIIGGATYAVDRITAGPSHRPNILFVLVDDLDLASTRYLPKTRALIGDQGATFDNYFVSDSLCCPSRATTLRGQYAHNTGVLSNDGQNGGFDAAYRNGLEQDTIATRLQDAGYRTALFGKYLNHYPGPAGDSYIPPGWSRWGTPSEGSPYREYNYTLNLDGEKVVHGDAPSDYGTDVYADLAEEFIDDSVERERPFFLSLDFYAPHSPSTPAPADVHRFPHVRAPRTESFDAEDLTGKPTFIRVLPQFTAPEVRAIDRLYRRRLQSLQEVDRRVAALVRQLDELDELDNTFIVFASDNGFHLGQNRLPAGKELPYDTDIRVPLLVRGPDIDERQHISQFALNTDLASTFLAMAGEQPTPYADGRSLLGVLQGDDDDGTHPRHSILLEHWPDIGRNGQPRVSGSVPEGIEEFQDADQFDPALHPVSLRGKNALRDHTLFTRLLLIPQYSGIRTGRYLYVEYTDGERELYDVRKDPGEIVNLAGTRPNLERRLAARLDELRSCTRDACRAAENAPL